LLTASRNLRIPCHIDTTTFAQILECYFFAFPAMREDGVAGNGIAGKFFELQVRRVKEPHREGTLDIDQANPGEVVFGRVL
jgi:hypothetical protein